MNKRANLYFAALLGAMSPLCTVSALAAQSNSTIATATQQQNSCTGTVKDATGEPIIGATIRIEGKTGGTVTDLDGNFTLSNIEKVPNLPSLMWVTNHRPSHGAVVRSTSLCRMMPTCLKRP